MAVIVGWVPLCFVILSDMVICGIYNSRQITIAPYSQTEALMSNAIAAQPYQVFYAAKSNFNFPDPF